MKPQTARWIFYTGTTLSLVLFIGLTVDTHRQVHALTNADQLSEEVIAGKKVWQKYNCNDCHTILGFGSYYGPDLTMVYRRRGEARIRAAVMTPEKVTTWRLMPHQGVTEQELGSLLAFLKWTGGIDTHDWPPQDRRLRAGPAVAAVEPTTPLTVEPAPPGAAPAPGVPAAVHESDQAERGTAAEEKVRRRALAAGISPGAELFREKGCFDCHRVEQVGSREGPELTDVGSRLTAGHLDSLLLDPDSVNPDAEMEKPDLSPAERAEMVRFLSGLRGRGGNAP